LGKQASTVKIRKVAENKELKKKGPEEEKQLKPEKI